MQNPILAEKLAKIPVAQYKYLESTGSTNDDALTWAQTGAEDFSLVVAGTQTRGRGRFMRKWITNPGAGLAFSLVLRPRSEETSLIQRFTALAALALVEALQINYHVTAQIKWPNDILVDWRKISGVLVEPMWMNDQLSAIILGMGINVRPAAVPPQNELRFPAISLEEVIGHAVDRWDLLAQVLGSLVTLRNLIPSIKFIQLWERNLAWLGQWVSLNSPEMSTGMVRLDGLSEDGSLRVTNLEGFQQLVRVGEIHLTNRA